VPYRIVNLGTEFSAFWNQAKGLPFERQVTVWEQVVESPQRDFYESVVWNRTQDPQWKKRRLERLHAAFQQYRKYAPAMEEEFKEFPTVLGTEVERFRKACPDARLAVTVFAVPSPTFDGKVDSLASKPEENVLAFGMEEIVDNQEDPNVLYAHELFHVYQGERVGLNAKVYETKGKFSLPLWEEGFATFASEALNPTVPLRKVLLSEKLAELSPKEIPWLASEYLKHVDEPALNAQDPSLYKKWFTSGDASPRPGLPARCGYFLGLHLLRHLAKTHSMLEMANWSLAEAHQRVVVGLRELQAGIDN
jgi:hypothetical protein